MNFEIKNELDLNITKNIPDSTLIISAYILENIIKINDNSELTNNNFFNLNYSIFDSNIYLKQKIAEYMLRINIFLNIDKNILILTMMNLDKFMLMNTNFILNKHNCFKLFLACLIETKKFYDDYNTSIKIFSSLGLVESKDIITIEKEFLERVNYNLFIKEEDFHKYKIKLEKLYNFNDYEIKNFINKASEKINYFYAKCNLKNNVFLDSKNNNEKYKNNY